MDLDRAAHALAATDTPAHREALVRALRAFLAAHAEACDDEEDVPPDAWTNAVAASEQLLATAGALVAAPVLLDVLAGAARASYGDDAAVLALRARAVEVAIAYRAAGGDDGNRRELDARVEYAGQRATTDVESIAQLEAALALADAIADSARAFDCALGLVARAPERFLPRAVELLERIPASEPAARCDAHAALARAILGPAGWSWREAPPPALPDRAQEQCARVVALVDELGDAATAEQRELRAWAFYQLARLAAARGDLVGQRAHQTAALAAVDLTHRAPSWLDDLCTLARIPRPDARRFFARPDDADGGVAKHIALESPDVVMGWSFGSMEALPASERSVLTGHLQMAVRVVHPHNRARIATLLDWSQQELEAVLSGSAVAVLDPAGDASCYRGYVLAQRAWERFLAEGSRVRAAAGAGVVAELLAGIDLVRLDLDGTDEPATKFLPPRTVTRHARNRGALARALLDVCAQPTWLLIDVLPVLPSDLDVTDDAGHPIARDVLVAAYDDVFACNAPLAEDPPVALDDPRRLPAEIALQRALDRLFAVFARGAVATSP